jgi:hypothetical protein
MCVGRSFVRYTGEGELLVGGLVASCVVGGEVFGVGGDIDRFTVGSLGSIDS